MIRLDGDKMSKSKGNLVAPEEILDREGADALRLAHLFVGPPQDDVDWEGVSIEGSSRFLGRLWRLATGVGRAARSTIAQPTAADDAIAQVDPPADRQGVRRLRALVVQHRGRRVHGVHQRALPLRAEPTTGARAETLAFAVDTLLLLMAPDGAARHRRAVGAAPRGGHVHEQPWPVADPAMLEVETVTMIVQVNGKVRDRIEVAARHRRRARPSSWPWRRRRCRRSSTAQPRRVIVKPPKLVNIVV